MLHGLKQGNEVLKEIHKQMNIESVEKLLEETAEAHEYQRVKFLETKNTKSYMFLVGDERNARQQFDFRR